MRSSPLYRSASILTAFAGLLAACSRPETPSTPHDPVITVVTAPVVLSSDPVPVEAAGVLSRKEESTLSFKTGGIIDAVRVRSGDSVAEGEVLATLKLDEMDAQVSRATAGAEKAGRDLERTTALHSDRVASLENLQDAQSAYTAAEAELKAARFNRDTSVIRAPARGRILKRLAEPSELAGPGRPVLVFAAQTQGWIVRTGISEADVLRLVVGDRAEVRLGDGAPIKARVSQIPEGTDEATRTIPVELELDAPAPEGWRSGFLVSVLVRPRPVTERATLPMSALVEGQGKTAYVFLVDAEKSVARRRSVEVESLYHDTAYLKTPLPAGSRVVTTGAEFLYDGRKVVQAPGNPSGITQ